jgi:deoxyribodipyrimidine photolyase-related protein
MSSTKSFTESVLVCGDQLFPRHSLLDSTQSHVRSVVFIESLSRMRQRRYYKLKVALVLSAMRHYAESLRAAGWTMDYREADSFTAGLQAHVKEFQPRRLLMLEAAEWQARQSQRALSQKLNLEVVLSRNTHFLCEQNPPKETAGKKLILENFYRTMRKHFGVLLEADGSPIGGAWSFDAENRQSYKGKPVPRAPLSFAPDAITQAVLKKVERECPDNIGSTQGFSLAVTREQALETLDDFITHRLPNFGAYEDAMSAREPVLFHSLLSPLLNIGLLEPLEVIRRAEVACHDETAPLNSVEGFIRQILGWREYVYWRYHQMMPDLHAMNHWQAKRSLPAFFWTGATEMNCLRHVITRVLETGYSHHIERLMVLCNFALLAGIQPRAVNEWFLESYVDAYDWVVTPNVIGMGLCADGGVVGTKPYIASAAYINKMSDYCGGCKYDAKQRTGDTACPFNALYWNFLLRFEKQLRANPRMGPNALGLKHLDETERQRVQQQAQAFLEKL